MEQRPADGHDAGRKFHLLRPLRRALPTPGRSVLILGMLLCCAAGRASGPRQTVLVPAYAGPPRPLSQVAILQAGPTSFIRAVDGKAMGNSSAASVLPGKHSVRLSYSSREGRSLTYSPHGVKVSFVAKAGRLYVVNAFREALQWTPMIVEAGTVLLFAAENGYKQGLPELLLADKADINLKTAEGATPLIVAAASGHADVAGLLIADGADVNVKDTIGRTPLFHAANKDVAELLLAHGADVNARDDDNRTPLFHATNPGVAEYLLAHGADVNARDKAGCTALFRAADRDSRDIAELLLAHGADVNAKEESGQTPLFAAADPLFGCRGFVDLVVPTDPTDIYLQVPMIAEEAGDIVELLLGHGANVNATDNKGDTPLHMAVDGGHPDVTELLLAHGANVNARDNKGQTPLYWAAKYGDLSEAKLLVAHGADVNAKDDKGQTPLREAKVTDNYSVADLLRQHGGHE